MVDEEPAVDDRPAAAAGTITIGAGLTVNRLGLGAMRVTGRGVWGPPADRGEAVRVLRRAVELGVQFIDTADSYGPDVNLEQNVAATGVDLTEQDLADLARPPRPRVSPRRLAGRLRRRYLSG